MTQLANALSNDCPPPGAQADRLPCLERLSARQRVHWALQHLPGPAVLTSSFGIQSAVMLHLMTEQQPDMPVIVIDTGYLFPETYRFIDQLQQRLQLNLKIYGPQHSAAWQLARHGELWFQGLVGIERYNQIHKVEPLKRALRELQVATWFSGLRRSQSSTRREVPVAERRQQRWKVLPIVDWSDRDVFTYLKTHDLPYHPLWEQGYVSVGDTHSSRPLAEAGSAEASRFFGLKRECGIHEEW